MNLRHNSHESPNQLHLDFSKHTETFEEKKEKIIKKYKIGIEAQSKLKFIESESNNTDDSSGWYIGNKTLKDWDAMWKILEEKSSDDNYKDK